MVKTVTFLGLLLIGSSFYLPQVVRKAQPPFDCLVPGIWGNDYPLCGRVIVKKDSRGALQKRLNEELRLSVQANGMGTLSFYDCQQQQRIPNPVKFQLTVNNGIIRLAWRGTPDEVRLATMSFGFRDSIQVRCRQDTVFVDSLLSNTMYRGATYFIRRN